MVIKRRSRLVIIISCFLISVVLALSMGGYYFYIAWKEEESQKKYTLALRELNAKLFSKYLIISGVVAKIEGEGLLKGEPIVEGSIKNISGKKITRLKIKMVFLDKDNTVIYLDSVHPLGSESYLLPNDSVSFKHVLEKCPRILRGYLVSLKAFAKLEKSLKITLRWQIEDLDVI